MIVDDSDNVLIALTADIAAAYATNNRLTLDDMPQLIADVYAALAACGPPDSLPELGTDPKVPIRSSIKPGYIVCLEDGIPLKMLKRHLMAQHRLTPDEYRRRWGLNHDYPMIAPKHAEQCRKLAKAIGLGTRPRKTPSAT